MKLLLTGAFNYSNSQIKAIKSLGYEIIFVQDERIPLNETLTPMEIETIEAAVCNGLFLFNDIEQFKNLKFIQLTSAGMDRVPLDYIKSHGIQFASARGVYSVPIAEWVILKILEIYKKSKQFYQNQNEHKWQKQRDLLELSDKTAVIIGFGSIGVEIAKRLKAFGVRVLAVDTRETGKTEADLIEELFSPDDLEIVIARGDIIILTAPLTEQTNHMINAKTIGIMKDTAVLINVSRGGLINEEDLINALNHGKFLGVALDVFENEPLPNENPLWDVERVILTPHNSFVSDQVNARLFKKIISNLEQYISTTLGGQ